MDAGITVQPQQTLCGFCQTVVTNHSGNWPPGEDVIAAEFIAFFQVNGVFPLDGPEKLCARLGINLSIQALPSGLRGYNSEFEEKREILVGEVDRSAAALGSLEHTILHESRELMEYEFRKIGRPVAIASDLESRAETFAVMTRARASMKGWEPLLEGIGGIQSTWRKIAVAIPILPIVLAQVFSCFLLPHWEDQLSK